jgi:hypothetical protein
MNAAARTAAQRNVDLDAQNCFAGEPVLVKTTNDIFFRMMRPPSFLKPAKKNPRAVSPRGLLCVIGNLAVLALFRR